MNHPMSSMCSLTCRQTHFIHAAAPLHRPSTNSFSKTRWGFVTNRSENTPAIRFVQKKKIDACIKAIFRLISWAPPLRKYTKTLGACGHVSIFNSRPFFVRGNRREGVDPCISRSLDLCCVGLPARWCVTNNAVSVSALYNTILSSMYGVCSVVHGVIC